MKFAYADPPYLGCGRSRYSEYHADAALWDDPDTHVNLARRLVDEYPDGWALSCNPRDLSVYLPALPPDIRIGAWCKTWHQIRPTTVQHSWEAVIWRGGRKDNKRTPMVRDWITARATRERSLPGAKPAQFNRWILDLLNYQVGDEVDDLFPGTGGMSHVLSLTSFF